MGRVRFYHVPVTNKLLLGSLAVFPKSESWYEWPKTDNGDVGEINGSTRRIERGVNVRPDLVGDHPAGTPADFDGLTPCPVAPVVVPDCAVAFDPALVFQVEGNGSLGFWERMFVNLEWRVTAPIDGAGLWWNPNGIAPLGAGQPVLFWPDATGHGRNGTYPFAFQAPVTTVGINGFMAAAFGNHSRLDLAVPWNIGTSVSTYVVFQPLGPGSPLNVIQLDNNAAPGAGIPAWTGSLLYYQDDLSIFTTFWPVTVNTPYTESVRRGGAAVELWFDVVQLRAGSINPAGHVIFKGASLSSMSFPFTNQTLLYEAIIFPFRLTDDDHLNVLWYLKSKYSL